MPKPDTEWQALIDEKIKIQLVAHITLAGRSLGTISIDPENPRNKYGNENIKLELFAGELSDDEISILRELLQRARYLVNRNPPYHSRLHQMELDLAKISSYKFCLRDL